jgi:hypothetical protein
LNIAYIAYASIIEQTGVFEKILCQVEALQSLNHKVHLIIIDSLSTSDISYNVDMNIICNKFAKLGVLSRYVFQFFVPNKLNRTLNLIKPDIIYFRYPLYLPFIGKVLYETKVPIVMEINGNPLDELQAKGERLIYFIEKNKGGSRLYAPNYPLTRSYNIRGIFDTRTPYLPPKQNVWHCIPNNIYSEFYQLLDICCWPFL